MMQWVHSGGQICRQKMIENALGIENGTRDGFTVVAVASGEVGGRGGLGAEGIRPGSMPRERLIYTPLDLKTGLKRIDSNDGVGSDRRFMFIGRYYQLYPKSDRNHPNDPGSL